MAKKKMAETANIKAAPVLRAGSDGGQPTPETPVITKSYSVRDEWKDINKVNYVAFKSVDGEVQDLTVNGEPAGGGGGSQATITLTNNTNGRGVAVYGPAIINNVCTFSNNPDDALVVAKGTTATLTVLLGPRGANLFMEGFSSPGDLVITGAISYDYDLGGFVVTGNGTITG